MAISTVTLPSQSFPFTSTHAAQTASASPNETVSSTNYDSKSSESYESETTTSDSDSEAAAKEAGGESNSGASVSAGLIAGTVAFAVIVLCVAAVFVVRKRRKDKHGNGDGGLAQKHGGGEKKDDNGQRRVGQGGGSKSGDGKGDALHALYINPVYNGASEQGRHVYENTQGQGNGYLGTHNGPGSGVGVEGEDVVAASAWLVQGQNAIDGAGDHSNVHHYEQPYALARGEPAREMLGVVVGSGQYGVWQSGECNNITAVSDTNYTVFSGCNTDPVLQKAGGYHVPMRVPYGQGGGGGCGAVNSAEYDVPSQVGARDGLSSPEYGVVIATNGYGGTSNSDDVVEDEYVMLASSRHESLSSVVQPDYVHVYGVRGRKCQREREYERYEEHRQDKDSERLCELKNLENLCAPSGGYDNTAYLVPQSSKWSANHASEHDRDGYVVPAESSNSENYGHVYYSTIEDGADGGFGKMVPYYTTAQARRKII